MILLAVYGRMSNAIISTQHIEWHINKISRLSPSDSSIGKFVDFQHINAGYYFLGSLSERTLYTLNV